MIVERLVKLAQILEDDAQSGNLPEGIERFSMSFGILFTGESKVRNECNTVCCIAGLAALTFSKDKVDQWFDVDVKLLELRSANWPLIADEAEELLGLSPDQSLALFTPSGYGAGDYDNPAWAARTIRHLIATGRVDWEATRYV
jgi:hypothetical protein